MIRTISAYFSLIAIHHVFFALPFVVVGFLMAIQQGYSYSVSLFLYIVGCMFFARNAAMSFNRYIDASIDLQNPRTRNRAIQKGLIAKQSVLVMTMINSILFIVTAWLISLLCFWLSFVALIVILGYSYMKRVTSLCHFVLGIGLALAPLGAYVAVSGHFDILPIVLSCAVLLWVAGFDIIYALLDEEFDKTKKIFSIPSILGGEKALKVSRLCHIICVFCFITIGLMLNNASMLLYWMGAITFSLLLVWQHIKVHLKQKRVIERQFFIFNGLSSVIFLIFFFFHYAINLPSSTLL